MTCKLLDILGLIIIHQLMFGYKTQLLKYATNFDYKQVFRTKKTGFNAFSKILLHSYTNKNHIFCTANSLEKKSNVVSHIVIH